MEDLQLPKGAYARIRFDGAVSGFLSTLADQLQTNAEGVFFSQLDPHAGLGCCPFHMKLISPSEMGGLRYLTVLNLLKDIGLKFEGIQGQVLPVCIVNRSGLVSLKISCSDFLPISKHIADVLPGAIDWSMKQENELTVTIGIFMGTHISAFESWLNGELSSNSSVFPVFFCDTIELSEECHPVVNEQIKLAGKLRQRNVQSSNQQGNSMSNITSHSNTDTSDKDKSSIEQRLLSAASTLCMKIGGTGMISINTPRSNQSNEPTSFSIIPTEPAKWHENCSKIFAMLDAMLRSVGSKNFVHALDVATNPLAAGSIHSALLGNRNSAYLVLTQETDLIVYAVANQNAGGHAAALKGLAIPLTLCPAKTTKLDNHGIVYTGSPLICIPVKKVNAPSYVMVALNISADSLVSLGLHPPEDKDHFFLVFGRIETSTYQQQGGSSVSYNNGSQNNNYNIAPIYNGSTTNRMGGKDGGVGSHANPSMRGGGGGIDMRGRGTYQGGGRGSGPLQRSPHAMQPQGHGGPHGSSGGPNSGGGRGYDQQHPVYPPAPVLPQRGGGGGGGGGGGNRHPGDWMCPVCKLLVFAYKPDCFRCHTLRPDKIGGGGGGGGATSTPHIPQTPLPRQPPRTNIRPDGDLRDGDWICELCSGHNFASKIACFTCRAPRPPGYELPPSATAKEGEGAAGGPTPASRQILPGDWTCPNCKENVFAKRSRCYKCSTSKSASFH